MSRVLVTKVFTSLSFGRQSSRPKPRGFQEDRVRRGKYLISNIVGTSHDSGSKKHYWERRTGASFSLCQVESCRGQATVGGHVWIRGYSPWYLLLLPRRSSGVKTLDAGIWFILPMCQVSTYSSMH